MPVLGFLLGAIVLLDRLGVDNRDSRLAFVLASVGWGCLVALSSELLSLVEGITLAWVAVVWGLLCAGLGVVVARSQAQVPAWNYMRERLQRLNRVERVFFGALLVVSGVLLAVAILFPPNTSDSALYHVTCVVHSAQNASLKPYPALFEHKLHKPVWAETAILHLRTLRGSDRPAGLVQWFSMLGSLVVVSGIAGLLKGGRGAQILAAAFCVSIPMGVLQATSTQNGYVAAF